MKHIQWILGIVLLGLVGNIAVLYWLFFDFKFRSEEKLANMQALQNQLAISEGDQTSPPPPALETGETTSCDASCEQSIENLAARVAVLEKDVPATSSVATTQQTTPQSSSVKEVIIPLGAGSTLSNEWEDIAGLSAYIDTSNYGPIKSAYFEASLRIPTANGIVYAQLFNKTVKHPVWNSEIKVESNTSTLVQSSPITIESGNNLYQVQARSTLRYLANIDSARIKILLK